MFFSRSCSFIASRLRAAPSLFFSRLYASSSRALTSSNTDHFKVPELKVLKDMVSIVRKMPIDFSKTVIFGVQHHLETTASLYGALQEIGIRKIYSIGKYYSTVPVVEIAMEKMGVRVFKGRKVLQPGHFYEAMCQEIQFAWSKILEEIAHEDYK